MACLQGDGSKDKKKDEVRWGWGGGKAYTLNIYFLKNANMIVILQALAGLERAVLGFLSTCGSAVCPLGRQKGF